MLRRPARTAISTVFIFAACAGGCATTSGDESEHPLSFIFDAIETTTPSEAARDAFNVYDADVRRKSVMKLASSDFGGEAPYVRMYRLLLDDPDPTVRAACIRALGMHGEVEDLDRIITHLEDRAAGVRWEAAKALQKIHGDQAIRPLIRRLDPDVEDDPDVRLAAADALGQYAQPAVFDALVGALNDQSFSVAAAARRSLVTLTGQDQLGTVARDWLAWADEHRDALFAERRTYTWTPYQEPPGLLDRAQFWREAEKAEPRTPVGVEAADAGSDVVNKSS